MIVAERKPFDEITAKLADIKSYRYRLRDLWRNAARADRKKLKYRRCVTHSVQREKDADRNIRILRGTTMRAGNAGKCRRNKRARRNSFHRLWRWRPGYCRTIQGNTQYPGLNTTFMGTHLGRSMGRTLRRLGNCPRPYSRNIPVRDARKAS